MAVTNCASLQAPMPSFGSGEIFGTKNSPKAVCSSSPPPRRVASFCFGVMWQEAQPPARNMVRPLPRSGARGERDAAATVCGIVSHQTAATATRLAAAAAMIDLRNRTPPPGLALRQTIVLMASVAGVADRLERRLESVQRGLGLGAIVGHRLGECGRLGVEVRLVVPDLRR